MTFLSNNTLSNEVIKNMTILHAFIWIFLLLVPIVTVWRWNIVGVLLGTIADVMIFVISDLITFRLHFQ